MPCIRFDVRTALWHTITLRQRIFPERDLLSGSIIAIIGNFSAYAVRSGAICMQPPCDDDQNLVIAREKQHGKKKNPLFMSSCLGLDGSEPPWPTSPASQPAVSSSGRVVITPVINHDHPATPNHREASPILRPGAPAGNVLLLPAVREARDRELTTRIMMAGNVKELLSVLLSGRLPHADSGVMASGAKEPLNMFHLIAAVSRIADLQCNVKCVPGEEEDDGDEEERKGAVVPRSPLPEDSAGGVGAAAATLRGNGHGSFPQEQQQPTVSDGGSSTGLLFWLLREISQKLAKQQEEDWRTTNWFSSLHPAPSTSVPRPPAARGAKRHEEVRPSCLAALLYALGRMRHQDSEVVSAVVAILAGSPDASERDRPLRRCSVKHQANIIWGLARLSFRPSRDWVRWRCLYAVSQSKA